MIKNFEHLKLFYGDWALVTGASSGIGKAFVYRLASMGINLIITARSIDRLIAIKDELEVTNSIKVVCVQADLSKKAGIEKVISEMSKYQPGLLVSNAGFGKIGGYADTKPDLTEDMVNVNCLASALLINSFCKGSGSKKKAIINISSVMAKLPLSYAALYSATKGFNLALGEALYFELKKQNIDIVTVLPGSTETKFDGFGNNISNSRQRKPDQVVTTAINALGKKPVVVDGVKNKWNVILSKLLPSSLRIKATGKISGRMYKKVLSQKSVRIE